MKYLVTVKVTIGKEKKISDFTIDERTAKLALRTAVNQAYLKLKVGERTKAEIEVIGHMRLREKPVLVSSNQRHRVRRGLSTFI